MIHSIFILNAHQHVLIEKHYRGTTSRPPPTPLPLSRTPTHSYITLSRNQLTFLAVSSTDSNPISVTQFLSTLCNTLLDYFQELNEHAIKDNFITVYELLDEMLDNGLPATLELNALKEIVPPPSMMNKVFETLGAEVSKLPANTPRIVPWRRSNVRHTNNEIFVDVIDTIDVIYNASNSSISHLLIRGSIDILSNLSGNPTVHIRLQHPLFDDFALHHCARLPQNSAPDTPSYLDSLSFVPPDGRFQLLTYTIRDTRNVQLPLQLSIKLTPSATTTASNPAGADVTLTSVSISIIPRFNPPKASPSKQSNMVLAHVISAAAVAQAKPSQTDAIMSNVVVTVPFGRRVTSASVSPNFGTVAFDSNTGHLTWNLGTVQRGKVPSLVGNISVKGSEPLNPQILVKFAIPGVSVANVSVPSLHLSGEGYNYYKGLKSITKGGTYEVRA